ncbi:MAG: hypothetical protein WBS54_08850 [Acidobacteriota bacterium]
MDPDASSRVSPAEPSLKSKGFTLKGALAYVDARFGEKARERLVAALDEESKTILSGSVLPSSWYPLRVQVELYRTIDQFFGSGNLALCREIGRYTAEHEISTIHRVTLKVAGLSLWLRSAGMMWRQYYSAGALRSEGMGERGGQLVLTEFNPLHRAFCEDLSGWFERIAELNGKERVTVTHPDCILDGRAACLFQASWRG